MFRMKIHPTIQIGPIIAFCLLFICSNSSFAQQAEDFEDVATVAQKGFFGTYFKGIFKGFFIVDPLWDMSGGINVNMRSYTPVGITPRQDPFFYSLNANLNLRLWKVQMPTSIAISAKNKDASYPNLKELFNAFKNNVEAQKDRFVRFGMSPRYKWMKLHFGNRNMTFSQFSLANLSYLGAGMELTPGKVRLSAMYGRLAKAIPIDLSLTSPNQPVYSRKAVGVKMGYGTQDEFIDFCWFNSADDPASITIPKDSPIQLAPEANEALAMVVQKTLFKKFKLKLDVGSSAISPNELDQTGKSQFPHFLPFFKATNTSLYKFAMDNSFNYEAETFTVGIQQKRIDPGFKSHGAYFANSDIQDINLVSTFGIMKGMFHFKLSGGFQQDNLDNSKPVTTTRLITTDNVTFTKNTLNLDLNYTNNSATIAYILSTGLDSLHVIIVSQDIGLNATWSKADKQENQHAINLSMDLQDVSDNVKDPTATAASKMLVGNLIYTYALSKSGWSFSTKGSFNQNHLSSMTQLRYGLGFGVNKNFMNGKITTGVDFNYLLTKMKGSDDSDNLTCGLKIGWSLNDKNSFNMAWNYLSNRTLAALIEKTGEFVGTFGYQYSFSKPNWGKKKTEEAPKPPEN